MRYICLLIILTLNVFSATAQQSELKKLVSWMAGSYSNYEQHIKDSQEYYHIRLEMIPIWQDRTDGYWLYVEQAMAGRESKPYRQRVYRVFQNFNGELESAIYTFDNALSYAQQPEKFEKEMSPENCLEKEGCSVFLHYEHQVFVGATDIGTCPSDRSGSKYATAEVSIYRNKMISWDRGWDENDRQVWGAEFGGYIFLKD